MNLIKKGLMLLACTGWLGIVLAQGSDVVHEKEIARLRKEIARVKAECVVMLDDAKKDQQDFELYKRRIAEKKRESTMELDSLRNRISREQQASDGLASEIKQTQDAQQELSLSQDAFRMDLVDACVKLRRLMGTYTPLVQQQLAAAVDILKNDIASKTIDLSEGISRFVQITARAEDIGTSIQVVQEHSPIPEITGTVYRLRIGTFFEAAVDEKGETGALFTGWNQSGAPLFKLIKTPGIAGELLKAVQMRERKALPSFISIPLAEDSLTKEQL